MPSPQMSLDLPIAPSRRAPSGGLVGAARFLWCLPLLLAGFCFWKAIPSVHRPTPAVAAVSAPAVARTAQSSARKLLTRPIQDIRVGQRVLAANPELAGQDVPQVQIDLEATRLVVLHQIKPDGHELTVETLWSSEKLFIAAFERLTSRTARPLLLPLPASAPDEIVLQRLLVGHTVDLDQPELGAAGPAEIVAVQPCPPIEPDDGAGRRLVTSVFRHSAANVANVTFTRSSESIGATATHPFWSEDRQAFVPAGRNKGVRNLY